MKSGTNARGKKNKEAKGGIRAYNLQARNERNQPQADRE